MRACFMLAMECTRRNLRVQVCCMLARVHTPSSMDRERERERKRVRKMERKREREYYLKGMTTGALAPFIYLSLLY